MSLHIRFAAFVALLLVALLPARPGLAQQGAPVHVASGVSYELIARWDVAKLNQILTVFLVGVEFGRIPEFERLPRIGDLPGCGGLALCGPSSGGSPSSGGVSEFGRISETGRMPVRGARS